jgi:hypothetical protein
MAESEIQQVPAWRAAVAEIRASGFKDGDIIEHDFLYAALGLDKPAEDTPWKKAQRINLLYMDAVIDIRDYFICEYDTMLASVHGKGYMVVPPGEQTSVSMLEVHDKIRKALQRGATNVSHVRLSELSDEQIRENADARCRLSRLQQMSFETKKNYAEMIAN